MSILVIDDDASVGQLIQRILTAEGFAVDHARTAEQGERLLRAHAYRGIVLDLGLGERSGFDVIESLRREGITTPVLVLTAESDEASVVRALNAGADEYVVKPMRHLELTARVHALIRRNESRGISYQLSVGNLVLDRLARHARVSNKELNLSPREFALLELMVLHADKVLSRAQVLAHVWGMNFEPGSNVVDVLVNRLRHKLTAVQAPVQISTRRGQGFVLRARTAPNTKAR